MQDLLKKASKIKMLVLDVDGILSNGKIIYDADGIESKAFSVQDAIGTQALHQYGIKTAIITGRSSPMVERRAKEMGIDYVIQGRDDKLVALQELLSDLQQEADKNADDAEGLSLNDCAYMGDDLPDLKALQSVGFAVTASNAHAEVMKRVDMVTSKEGGSGAVREVCDLILKGHGHYDDFLSKYLLSE